MEYRERNRARNIFLTTPSATILNSKIRDKVISTYQEKGYHIFQVDFQEYYDDIAKAFDLEHFEKLSPLRIETYYHGSIKAIAKPFRENPKEEKKKKIYINRILARRA
jgi:hypothetical protein